MLAQDRGDYDQAARHYQQSLAIRLSLGVPEAAIDLRRLAGYRRTAGPDQFAVMLS